MIVVRAFLAVVLLAGFYVFGLGSVVVLGGLSLWLLWTVQGEIAHDVSYAMIALALGLAVPVWRMVRARPTPPPGEPVTQEQAPQLWSLVRELAVEVGTRPPDEIRLDADVNAGVWEDAGLVGLRPGRRYLYLGAPLLECVTVSQLRAVLAHELGHYAGGHTLFGAVTYRGMRSIMDTLDRLGPRSLAGALLAGYTAVYALVALAVMRQMEVEADRAAVRAGGREAMKQALGDMPWLSTAWEAYLDDYVGWIGDGYTAAEVLAYFGKLVEWRAPELDRVPERVAAAKPPRWASTHPPVKERLALIDREPDRSVMDDPRPAWVLVDDLELRSTGLQTTAFDDHLAVVAQEEARLAAKQLYHAAARVSYAGRKRGGIGTVLDLLAAGRTGDLTAALNRAVPDPWPLADRVLAAVNATLVISADAGWRHSWSAPMTLVSADGEDIAVRPLVEQACDDPEAVPRLREFLHGLGVPEVVTRDTPAGGYEPLDSGPALPTLMLPDILFIIANTGRRQIPDDVLAAGLAAAALAELRLLGRVEVADTPEATVRVAAVTATGDGFLDSVLDWVAQAGSGPAYLLLQTLGSPVAGAVGSRAHRWIDDSADIARTARTDIVEALDTGDLDGRAMALGALLWGTELAGPVLGWRSRTSRFWLGRVARRDRLALAIRTVIGIHIQLPYTPRG